MFQLRALCSTLPLSRNEAHLRLHFSSPPPPVGMKPPPSSTSSPSLPPPIILIGTPPCQSAQISRIASPSPHFTHEKTNTQGGDICHPVLPLGPSSSSSPLVRSAELGSAYSVLGPILGTEDTAVGQTDRRPAPWSSQASSSWRLSLIPEAGLEVPHGELQWWVDSAFPLG